MEFDLTQDFPVGLDRLWSALGRADYVEQKYASLGSTSLRMSKFTGDARSIEVELERLAPVAAGPLPLWARFLAGTRQPMRHHTRWTRTGPDRVDAWLDIRAVGQGVAAVGTGTIAELSPTLSRMTLHFAVTSASRVSKLGVATVFARQVKHALEADHAFTIDYLRAGSRRR